MSLKMHKTGSSKLITAHTLLILVAMVPGSYEDQTLADYMANNLRVDWVTVDNWPIADWAGFKGRVEFTNVGNMDITTTNWTIYMPSIRFIRDAFPNGTEFGEGQGLFLRHINGDVYTIEPTEDFNGFLQGQPVMAEYIADVWVASRTDAMPNWYVTVEDSLPRVFRSTVGEELSYVGPFMTERQWRRTSFDLYDPFTPEARLDWSMASDCGEALIKVIPTPKERFFYDDSVSIVSDWVVVRDYPTLQFEADFLAGKLSIGVVDSANAPSTKYISVTIGAVIDLLGETVLEDEAYNVEVLANPSRVHITGNDSAGAFYGVQTLLSLYAGGGGVVPRCRITDYPRYPYRGMHMDVSRNFHTKEDVLRHMEALAMYKINHFHFHITDDEGWRLEVPGLPELTEVGAMRCHDLSGDYCILPQLGAGPTMPNLGSGYYTVEDYRDILRFAADRHITVIPEFDMPGHAHAAINAMEARYRRYRDTNLTAAEEFLLSDLEDESVYISIQMYTDNAVNPCINSTYRFVEKLMDEVITMHADIQPLTVYNYGGDEVPHGAWVDSPRCVEFMQQHDYEHRDELKKHFVLRVAELAHARGLDLSAWEDGLLWASTGVPYNRSLLPNDNVYGYFWDNVWEWGTGHRAYTMVNAGYKGVLSHATHLYFDFPYEPDPEERGYYWATRFTDVRKTFGFTPADIYQNMDIKDLFGRPIDPETVCESFGCPPLEPGREDSIVGIQGQLWSETVRRSEHLDYMVFPRMVAVAERAWHHADWELMELGEERNALRVQDWKKFANTLGHKELARLGELGIAYHIPPPGARFDDGMLNANTNYPGLPIQYSVDDGVTWIDYVTHVMIDPHVTVRLRTRSADNGRTSRVVYLEPHTVDGAAHTATYTSLLTCLLTALCCVHIVKRN